jgi:hypothetical protein
MVFVVEAVEILLNIAHSSRGDLRITLTSPHGTTSILHPGKIPENTQLRSDEYWKLMTVRNWGESPFGEWTLTITDAKAGDLDTCVDVPDFSFDYTNVDVTCSYIEKAGICLGGGYNQDFFNSGNYNSLKSLTDAAGNTITQACCLCGGGIQSTSFQNILRHWTIAVYGREEMASSTPSAEPSVTLSSSPTMSPSSLPTVRPTFSPSEAPTRQPTAIPSAEPSDNPSQSVAPSVSPSSSSSRPTSVPTDLPSAYPTFDKSPSVAPSRTMVPSISDKSPSVAQGTNTIPASNSQKSYAGSQLKEDFYVHHTTGGEVNVSGANGETTILTPAGTNDVIIRAPQTNFGIRASSSSGSLIAIPTVGTTILGNLSFALVALFLCH